MRRKEAGSHLIAAENKTRSQNLLQCSGTKLIGRENAEAGAANSGDIDSYLLNS